MRLYSAFYKEHGIRNLMGVDNPPLSPVTELKLPKESILHHIPSGDLDIGPTPGDPSISCYEGRVLVAHHFELVDPNPIPRPDTNNTPASLTADYKKRFKKLRPVSNVEKSIRDERALIVHNYSPFVQSYLYPTSTYSNYYKWNNAITSSFKTISKMMDRNTRQHFIVFDLPEKMPTLKMLKKVTRNPQEMPQKLMRIFSQPEYQMLFLLWDWMGVNRPKSLIGEIGDERYDRFNIIITESGKWVVFNLAKMIEVFKQEAKDDQRSVGDKKSQYRFYDLLMTLLSLRNGGSEVSQLEYAEDDEAIEPEAEPKVVTVKSDTSSVVNNLTKGLTPEAEPPKKEPVAVKSEVEDDDSDDNIDEIEDELDAWDNLDVAAENKSVEVIDFAYKPTKDKLKEAIEKKAEAGRMSAPEYRRFEKLLEVSESLPNPFGGKGTLKEFATIKPEDVEITEDERLLMNKPGVTDESLKKSTIQLMDKKYINNVLKKDIVNSAMAVSNADFIVTDMQTERVRDAMNDYTVYRLKVTPIEGESSTLVFRVHNVGEDGVYVANGVKCRMRKQRGDLPIRKITPYSVALTSYYAKIFVQRSQMKVVNYAAWINNQIRLAVNTETDDRIKSVIYGTVFDPEFKAPRIYSIIGNNFKEVITGDGYRLIFDHKDIEKHVDEKLRKKIEKMDMTFCGIKGKTLVLVDNNDVFYTYNGVSVDVIGKIESILKLDESKAPIDIAELDMFGKNVPVGIVLGYFHGLSSLMKTLGVTPRRVPAGGRMNLQPNEYAIRFNDETLVFNREDRKASLVLSGLNRYARDIRRYSVDDFDDPEVFVNVMESNGIRIGFVREVGLAKDLFVDPITLDILKDMNEPLTFDGLILRSCELLLTDWHPRENDLDFMRIRGYERVAGAIYSEMVRSVRKFRSRGAGAPAKLEMNPEAVWHAIGTDTSVSQVEELNPIENIRESELVTYMGTGGRSTQSMVKRTRAYNDSDIGIISEGSVDSGSVGVNTYLSQNPNFKSLRGISSGVKPKDVENSSLLSTASLISPGAEYDDPKRMMFAGIQHKHGVATEGSVVPPLRTGAERVIAHRTSSLFAHTAKQDGKVTDVTDKLVTVQYKDGTTESVEIGRRFGTVPGVTVPHEIKTELKVGQSVKAGDIVAYNKGFFSIDPLDKTQARWMAGTLARVALMESATTFEDACEISQELAGRIKTKVTHIRDVVIPFSNVISNIISVGTETDSETILCTIEEGVISQNELFDEKSLDILKTMSENAPKAKYAGVVEKIEVLYHGDKDDMSDSLRKLTAKSDKELAMLSKAVRGEAVTGQVDGSTRINKDPLDLDTAVVRIYITEDLPGGIGDKGVFGNQMKTIISSIMTGVNTTKDGVPFDAKFSYLSIGNRIVASPEIIGTTNTILIEMSKLAANHYFNMIEKGA